MVVLGKCYTITTFADENQIGGQVGTKGVVSFYEEKVFESEESSTEPEKTEKPKGRLPSTGEFIKASLSVSGMAVLFFCGYLVFKKKRKNGNGG